jgi:hypothetical protein
MKEHLPGSQEAIAIYLLFVPPAFLSIQTSGGFATGGFT